MKWNFHGFTRVAVISALAIVAAISGARARAQDKTISSRTADVEGVRLQYLTAGKGPAVILLHGYAETSRMWQINIPVLAERFAVIEPQFSGIADSSIL